MGGREGGPAQERERSGKVSCPTRVQGRWGGGRQREREREIQIYHLLILMEQG